MYLEINSETIPLIPPEEELSGLEPMAFGGIEPELESPPLLSGEPLESPLAASAAALPTPSALLNKGDDTDPLTGIKDGKPNIPLEEDLSLIQPRMRRTNDDFYYPKNAKELGSLNFEDTIVENNSIGFRKSGVRDRRDIYSFSLAEAADLNLSLDGLKQNANLFLLDAKCKKVAESKATGSNAETINEQLPAGDYFVKIVPVGNAQTDYELSLEATTSSDNIFELVINQVKPGELRKFNSARELFISKLEKEEGFEDGATFESFFVLPPDELTSEVFVRLTEWDSIEAFERANKNLTRGRAFERYSRTFNELASVQIEPEDGEGFDIDDITKDGQTVEFAVRTTLPEFVDVFPERRKAFFDSVAEQEGYVLDREFVAVEGDKRVPIIVWDSPENFQNGAQVLSQGAEIGEFFSIVDVEAYQATTKVN